MLNNVSMLGPIAAAVSPEVKVLGETKPDIPVIDESETQKSPVCLLSSEVAIKAALGKASLWFR